MHGKTLFIADLHLDKSNKKSLNLFINYFNTLKNQSIDAVYILGDLFEYWLGDDCVDNTAKTVASVLSLFHKNTQAPIYFIHGNRDFLLGDSYAKSCCMTILPEKKIIDLYGVSTLILHGDTLCIDDVDYMKFRKRVRNIEWKKKILSLPIFIRKLKAWQMRRKSKKANAIKDYDIMDVSQAAIDKLIKKEEVKQIIHGHTHRPMIHDFEIDGAEFKRVVLGDWCNCYGSVLIVTKDNIDLSTLQLH